MPDINNRKHPLTGIRIVDLTNVIAGPVSTRVLAQLGAEVIKIEVPWGRAIGNIAMHTDVPGEARPYNKVASFNEVNRGKQSIAIDLAQEDGRNLLREIISVSDVVIENYSPRVMGNLGLSYDSLVKERPDLVMVSMPALGGAGPWSSYISFGPGTDALGGLSDITGYQSGPPHKPGNYYADHNSAFHVSTGIMAALSQRRRTGKGQRMEIVLREVTMAVIGEQFLGYQLSGEAPERMGSRHRDAAPHNIYPCSGDDEWVVIAVESDEEWRQFRKTIGSPAWSDDDRFSNAQGRVENQDELDSRIGQWTKNQSKYQVMTHLQKHGVKAGAVLKSPDVLSDPHFKDRKFIDETDHQDAGTNHHPGLPFRLSRSERRMGSPAPMFAEHSDWALAELLCLEPTEIARLREQNTAPLKPVDRRF
ncbi:MAG: CoA transferase [SAR202 cluster bacterium]|jgi:benzylsuccinate CoA-transferase BbsF subunit|nr:CoA transferase [SAR202 cluster bacterium]MDP6514048.1 CoA transferase [SAR202 cluster bacterium]MDP6715782.1 CoA transferase [SAR202 cluster bacterium]